MITYSSSIPTSHNPLHAAKKPDRQHVTQKKRHYLSFFLITLPITIPSMFFLFLLPTCTETPNADTITLTSDNLALIDDWVEMWETPCYLCTLNADPPASLRQDFADYYAATEYIETLKAEFMEEWLAQHTEILTEYESRYTELKPYLEEYYLIGKEEATTWYNAHPAAFTDTPVSLTDAFVSMNQPVVPADSIPVPDSQGSTYTYLKFFIDQPTETLYVSPQASSMQAVDISSRYQPVLQGDAGEISTDDFFIYLSQYGYQEDTTNSLEGDSANLMVLDVSDPSNIQEIASLELAIAGLEDSTTRQGIYETANGMAWKQPYEFSYASINKEIPPTFDEYIAILEDRYEIIMPAELIPQFPKDQAGVVCDESGECTITQLTKTENPQAFACDLLESKKDLDKAPQYWHYTRYFYLPNAKDDEAHGSQYWKEEDGWAGAPQYWEDGDSGNSAYGGGGAGGAGSLMQMLVYQDYLYVLRPSSTDDLGLISVFDISVPTEPVRVALLPLELGPDALTMIDNLLIVPGKKGMTIISLAEPANPRLLATFRPDFLENCFIYRDPIAVKGTIVYRTIADGYCSWSGDIGRELQVIDFQNPVEPRLLSRIPLSRPLGVALLGDYLFIADNDISVRVFDVSDPENITEAGLLSAYLPKDLIINHFDLYILTEHSISTYYIAPLYGESTCLVKDLSGGEIISGSY